MPGLTQHLKIGVLYNAEYISTSVILMSRHTNITWKNIPASPPKWTNTPPHYPAEMTPKGDIDSHLNLFIATRVGELISINWSHLSLNDAHFTINYSVSRRLTPVCVKFWAELAVKRPYMQFQTNQRTLLSKINWLFITIGRISSLTTYKAVIRLISL